MPVQWPFIHQIKNTRWVFIIWWAMRDSGLRPFPLRRARNMFLRASSLHRTSIAAQYRFSGPSFTKEKAPLLRDSFFGGR
jgi:hypothetical protein